MGKKLNVVLITGSRYWDDESAIVGALALADVAILGDARGADQIALSVCKMNDITRHKHVAKWKAEGAIAGPNRNQRMVDQAVEFRDAGHSVQCHAFVLPQSRGTLDCINRIREAGLPLTVHS